MYGSHEVTRIRREPKRRIVTVTGSEYLTPHLLRLNFAGDDLADFDSAAPDDHVKLFFPLDAGEPAGEAAMRDYTPRIFDAAAGTLVIDFAVHQAGPATAWALAAQPGDTLNIGGPRGSTLIADDFDWYLLIGDETAIPSISRRLEELRAEAKVIALLAVEDAADCAALPEHPGLTSAWHVRSQDGDDLAGLIAAISAHGLPQGDGFVWIGAEASVARGLRGYLIDTLHHPRAWLKASGYWARGIAGEHVKLAD